MNRYYQVSGDMGAEKSRDAYPYMSLCDDCVDDYEVIFEGESTSDSCEGCGCSGVQQVDCDNCNGTGVITECPDCAGVEDDCPTCEGVEYNEECQECNGSGTVSK